MIDDGRIRLRRLLPSNEQDFYEYFLDESAADFLGGYPPSTKEGAKTIFDEHLKSGYCFGIELISNGKIIGDVHFDNIINGYLAYVGMMIHRDYRAKGYGSAALGLATDIGFNTLMFIRIRAIVILRNIPSQKMVERNGYMKEAIIYDGDYGGRIEDIIYYSKSVFDR